MGYFDWHGEVCPGDVVRHIPPGAHVLDLGCGTGWLADRVASHVGLDGSEDAVLAARQRGRDVRLWQAGDPVPFGDGTFGAVVVKDVLEHLGDPVSVVREIRRVLQPGGVAVATVPDAQRWVWDDYTHRRPYTRRGLTRLFTDHGFTVQSSGYDCLVRGTTRICQLMPSGRRPLPLRVLARLGAKRNVWVRASRA